MEMTDVESGHGNQSMLRFDERSLLIVLGKVLLGMVPLGLTALVFFMTIYPSADIMFSSQRVRESLDEVTKETNKSTVNGYIKIILQHKKQATKSTWVGNITKFFVYIV